MDMRRWSLSEELVQAVIENDRSMVEMIIEYADGSVNETNSNGESLLVIAVKMGSVDMVRYLVERGAPVNKIGQDGYTALLHAARNGHVDVIRFLIKEGAKIKYQDNELCNVFMVFCKNVHRFRSKYDSHQQVELLKYLLSVDHTLAEVSDRHHNTALHWTCNHGDEAVVSFLITTGLCLDAQNDTQFTPLHMALRSLYACRVVGEVARFRKIVMHLVKAGASLSLRDRNGLDAYDWVERVNDRLTFNLNYNFRLIDLPSSPAETRPNQPGNSVISPKEDEFPLVESRVTTDLPKSMKMHVLPTTLPHSSSASSTNVSNSLDKSLTIIENNVSVKSGSNSFGTYGIIKDFNIEEIPILSEAVQKKSVESVAGGSSLESFKSRESIQKGLCGVCRMS